MDKINKGKVAATGTKQTDILKWIVIITGILLYINTLNNKYALDDSIVINQNKFTKQGFQGIPKILTTDSFHGFFGQQKDLVAGGRYRPLSLITFAVEYQFFGLNPVISHLLNAVLYALTMLMIYQILRILLKENTDKKWYHSISFLATMIYAVHPVHTEVVANIKGRDEILSFLGALLALWFVIIDLNQNKLRFKAYAVIAFFAGLMSKENAIVFVVLIPIAVWYFMNASPKKSTVYFIILALPALIFLIIRQSVLGAFSAEPPLELMNNPFAQATIPQKYATIFLTFLWYLRLLIIPYPLTYDYYPYHVPLAEWNNWQAISGLIITLVIVFTTIVLFIKKHPSGYFLLFALLAFIPMSNLIFPVGTFMNERFLYVSSLGFIAAISIFLINKSEANSLKYNRFIQFFMISLTIVFSVLTISRNRTWKDDFTLFTTDVKTSVNSAKGNCTAGGNLWETAIKQTDTRKKDSMLRLSLSYLDRAVTIYPQYNDARLLRGNAIWELHHDFDAASAEYFDILKRSPHHQHAISNLLIITSKINDVDKKIETYLKLIDINQEYEEPFYQAGVLYARYKNDFQKAIPMLEKAAKLKPNKAAIFKDLGVAYGLTKNYEKSKEALLKAWNLDKNDPQTCYNLALTFSALNDMQNATEFMQKYKELSKKK